MRIPSVIIALVTAGLLWACSAAPPAPTAAPTGAAASPPGAKAGPQQGWDALVAEAKKEGLVAVYTLWRPETRTAVPPAFKEKYGIDVDFTPFLRGSDLLARVQAEQRAGLEIVDLFGAGGGSLVTSMKPAGLLGQIGTLLVLPEVTNPAGWKGGEFPFMDKDKTAIAMIGGAESHIVYNTDLIKKGEITNYKDLLKPQYKRKITLNDPTVTGPGSALMGHLAVNIWNLEETKDYLRRIVRDQEAEIQRDHRVQLESVARGKYPIGLAPNPDVMAEFFRLGATIEGVVVPEGVFVSAAAGAIAVPVKPAHPNAAKLFINWLLTKEGQAVFSKSFGSPSLRVDVSTEGFNPLFVPQPGLKLFRDNEETMLFRAQMLSTNKQVMDEARK